MTFSLPAQLTALPIAIDSWEKTCMLILAVINIIAGRM